MKVYQVQNADDYSDYLADKGLATAYKQRREMEVTHSFDALARKWLEHEAAANVLDDKASDAAPNT